MLFTALIYFQVPQLYFLFFLFITAFLCFSLLISTSAFCCQMAKSPACPSNLRDNSTSCGEIKEFTTYSFLFLPSKTIN
ncbi:unnamed protein product [Meloidogyne enterolobii]|uniref:Uncharacterized protein n=1 Tax=Meloidogyne enterolobii TaxID=390850 RepID=A0ACB1B2L2_MELEN